MAGACRACSGTGFGHIDPGVGYRDTGQPCTACNANAKPREPGSFAPKPARNDTVAYVDGVPDRVMPNSAAQGPEAFFAASEIVSQRARDAAREAGMGLE